MTTILNEQKVLNLETISGSVKLNCDAHLTDKGDIISINGSIQVENVNVGSFNVNQAVDSKLSTSINVYDSANISATAGVINQLILDIKEIVLL